MIKIITMIALSISLNARAQEQSQTYSQNDEYVNVNKCDSQNLDVDVCKSQSLANYTVHKNDNCASIEDVFTYCGAQSYTDETNEIPEDIITKRIFNNELETQTEIMGRLLSANCNSATGIAEIEVFLYMPVPTKEPEGFFQNWFSSIKKQKMIAKYNVWNPSLCRKNGFRESSQLLQLSMDSIFGMGSDLKEKIVLHKFKFKNGIIRSINEITLSKNSTSKQQKELFKVYNKFNLLSLNEYPVYDKRVIPSEMSEKLYSKNIQVLYKKFNDLIKE